MSEPAPKAASAAHFTARVHHWSFVLLGSLLSVLLACGSSAPEVDGGGMDSAGFDANGMDATVLDALELDAPELDGSTPDSGPRPDAGPPPTPTTSFGCTSTLGSYANELRVGAGGIASIRAALSEVQSNGWERARIVVSAGHDEGSLSGSLGAYEDVLITSEEPYAARITDIDIGSGDVVQHITFEGFEIGPAPGIVIKMDGGRTTNENVHHVTFRNNIIHESGRSDVVKINAGSNEIRLEWNVIYGHNDDAVDLNSVEIVFVENNVFFDLQEERHRNLLVIKDSTPVGAPDFYESTRNAIVRGNVFFGWHGGGNSAMLALGEDNDRDAYAVQHALVENNVFIGDGDLSGCVAPISLRGVRGITVRHNTFTGPFAGARSWGFLAWEISEPSRILTEDVFIYNNVWADERVRASRFSKSDEDDVGAFVLDNNLYWNGGSDLPFDSDQGVIDPREDSAAVRLDPGLAAIDGALPLPTWQRNERRFADGSTDICGLRARLIDSHAQPTESSAVSGMGRSEVPSGDEFPATEVDARGQTRGAAPELP